MSSMTKKVVYLDGEGRTFTPETIKAVKNYLKGNDTVNTVVIFTAEGEGPLALATATKDLGTRIVAVTFPFGQVYKADADGKEQVIMGIVDPTVRKKMATAKIEVVQGTMPFQDILIPGASDPKIQAIVHALRVFGGGTELCVQAVVMACDAGRVAQGEEVVAMAADTALLVAAARKVTMFSPFEGLEVREVICKPRVLNVTRQVRKEGQVQVAAAKSKH